MVGEPQMQQNKDGGFHAQEQGGAASGLAQALSDLSRDFMVNFWNGRMGSPGHDSEFIFWG